MRLLSSCKSSRDSESALALRGRGWAGLMVKGIWSPGTLKNQETCKCHPVSVPVLDRLHVHCPQDGFLATAWPTSLSCVLLFPPKHCSEFSLTLCFRTSCQPLACHTLFSAVQTDLLLNANSGIIGPLLNAGYKWFMFPCSNPVR